MNLSSKIILFGFILLFYSCADNSINKSKSLKKVTFYSSNGFALIYSKNLYNQGGIDKKLSNNETKDNKINNEEIIAMHSLLKRNTLIKIINPENSKFVETKVFKKANYPKIFNIAMSRKIATILELDVDNPYVEVLEIKKNKTFIAKESNTFEEEKQVAGSAPVDEVKMDVISEEKSNPKKVSKKNYNFILVISDFYYYDTANNLKSELMKKISSKKFSVKKIKDNKYRLFVGPFENFNALKNIYISLNNLGFEGLNIFRE